MPFVAQHRVTGERIDITRYRNPSKEIQPQDCICPLCEGDLIMRIGLIRQPHFAHRATCESQYKSNPESAAHRNAKLYLQNHLREEFPEYTQATIELEVKLEPIWRVADLLVTFPTGLRQAHEVQLASITTGKLQERTNDYTSMGVDVVWWLGGHANTQENQLWCIETFGYSLSIQYALEE
ncbi:competence protein CoiA [Dictyobacter halimunensis]